MLRPKGLNRVRVADMAALMEHFAPIHLAESWDNCGLQAGALQWEVQKVWVSLDPLLSVVEAAADQDVDMLITHHPLIFRPLHRIDMETPEGKIIAIALQHRMAIYAAHTNLDSASDGINDQLALKIGLVHLEPLVPAIENESGSGVHSDSEKVGIGRIGKLKTPATGSRLARRMKKYFGLSKIKIAGNCERVARKVAVCSGSGGSLLDAFLASDAEVFVSGDLHYHDARAVEYAGRCIIDIGHFASEHLMVESLYRRLKQVVAQEKWNVTIAPCGMEQDPFNYL